MRGILLIQGKRSTKAVVGLRRRDWLTRASVSCITVALVAGMVGCVPAQYSLTVSSTEGGEVITPGEGTFTYYEGEVVDLVASGYAGYHFVEWTGDTDTIDDLDAATASIAVNRDCSIVASFVPVYDLTVSSTTGGSVTTPGEGTFTYDEGTVVDLVAMPDDGYQFLTWTGDVGTIGDINAASTTITVTGDYSISASFAREVRTWYDLDAIRGNLGGSYALMNDLDAATAGYAELASETADDGSGWRPIGTLDHPFAGAFDGQGYLVRDASINRPGEDWVGLFGAVGEGGLIKNAGVIDVAVTGGLSVGGLAGRNCGTVRDSCSTGSVVGDLSVGGLVGLNVEQGIVRNCYSINSVAGREEVGGLVGTDFRGIVSYSYSGGKVVGDSRVGGLVGDNHSSFGIVSYSFWDLNTSGIGSSAEGTGRTTTEMKDITTFLGAAWDIAAVAPGVTNPDYTWNIVDGETYPFLSWQSVS